MSIIIAFHKDYHAEWSSLADVECKLEPSLRWFGHLRHPEVALYERPNKEDFKIALDKREGLRGGDLENYRSSEIEKHRKKKVEANAVVFENFIADAWILMRDGQRVADVATKFSLKPSESDVIYFTHRADLQAYHLAKSLDLPFERFKILPDTRYLEKSWDEVSKEAESIDIRTVMSDSRSHLEHAVRAWIKKFWGEYNSIYFEDLWSEREISRLEDVEGVLNKNLVDCCDKAQFVLIKRGSDFFTSRMRRVMAHEMLEHGVQSREHEKLRFEAKTQFLDHLDDQIQKTFIGLKKRRPKDTTYSGGKWRSYWIMLDFHILPEEGKKHCLVLFYAQTAEARNALKRRIEASSVKGKDSLKHGQFPTGRGYLVCYTATDVVDLIDRENWPTLTEFYLEGLSMMEEIVRPLTQTVVNAPDPTKENR